MGNVSSENQPIQKNVNGDQSSSTTPNGSVPVESSNISGPSRQTSNINTAENILRTPEVTRLNGATNLRPHRRIPLLNPRYSQTGHIGVMPSVRYNSPKRQLHRNPTAFPAAGRVRITPLNKPPTSPVTLSAVYRPERPPPSTSEVLSALSSKITRKRTLDDARDSQPEGRHDDETTTVDLGANKRRRIPSGTTQNADTHEFRPPNVPSNDDADQSTSNVMNVSSSPAVCSPLYSHMKKKDGHKRTALNSSFSSSQRAARYSNTPNSQQKRKYHLLDEELYRKSIRSPSVSSDSMSATRRRLGIPNSRDSSRCPSPHGSVSESIESESHISVTPLHFKQEFNSNSVTPTGSRPMTPVGSRSITPAGSRPLTPAQEESRRVKHEPKMQIFIPQVGGSKFIPTPADVEADRRRDMMRVQSILCGDELVSPTNNKPQVVMPIVKPEIPDSALIVKPPVASTSDQTAKPSDEPKPTTSSTGFTIGAQLNQLTNQSLTSKSQAPPSSILAPPTTITPLTITTTTGSDTSKSSGQPALNLTSSILQQLLNYNTTLAADTTNVGLNLATKLTTVTSSTSQTIPTLTISNLSALGAAVNTTSSSVTVATSAPPAFSFVTTGPSSTGQSSNTQQDKTSTAPPAFNFNNAASQPITSSTTSTNNQQPAAATGTGILAFGGESTTTASINTQPSVPSFGFGQTSNPASSSITNTTQASAPAFSFGGSITKSAADTSQPITVFGAKPAASSSTGTPSFHFGAVTTTSQPISASNNTPVFSFGSNQSGQPVASNPSSTIFGTNSTAASTFSGATLKPSPASVFGASTTAQTAGSALGVPSSSNSGSAIPTFGAASTTTADSSIFRAASTSASTVIFGAGVVVTSSAPSVFGSHATTSTTNPFGQTPTANPFGSSAETSSKFGNNVTSKSGVGSSKSTLAFGQTSSTTPAFGTSSSTVSTFGNSSSTVPTFDNSSSTVPTFGNSSSTVPTFGVTTSAPLIFGSSGTSSTASVFGTTTVSTSAQPAFNFGGNSSSTVPIFGSGDKQRAPTGFFENNAVNSSATPAFGGQSNSSSVFAFGSNSSNSANPVFGATAPSSVSTGTPFSGFSNTNPGSTTNAIPIFGSTNVTNTSTPFNFGANKPNANSINLSVPQTFQFSTAGPPQFSTSGTGFSVGTSKSGTKSKSSKGRR